MLLAMVLIYLSNKRMLTDNHKKKLKQIAKDSIEYGLSHQRPLAIDLATMPAELSTVRATFVTLEINDQLRGCIGMLTARRPLAEDVADNSYAAAYSDTRFPPVDRCEINQLSIHISILNPAEQLDVNSETDLIQLLRPGIDGLIIKDKLHRATFLPSVWQSLPQAEDFVRQLKVKAGFDANYWSKDMCAYRYTTDSF